MSITYSIDSGNRFIHTRWSGKVTAGDLMRHWQELFNDPQALEIRRSIADMREASLEFDGAQLRDVIRSVAQPLLRGQKWTVALLVKKPEQYGTSRQFQVFAEQVATNSIFYDYDEAVRWLVDQPRSPEPSHAA